MKKKILLILLSFYVYSAHAMEEALPVQKDTPEQRLINAIRNDDVEGVRNAIAQGANTKDPLPMNPYDPDKLESPISYALRNDKPLEIANLLFAKGVNQADLNASLRVLARTRATNRLKWLIDHGAKDINNEARGLVIKDMAKPQPPYTPTIEQYQENLKLLEQAK